MADTDEAPYQRAGQVRQLLAERANALAYGQSTRVEAVDKQLAALGHGPGDADPDAGPQSPPRGRAARPLDRAAAEPGDEPDPPGRRAPVKSET